MNHPSYFYSVWQGAVPVAWREAFWNSSETGAAASPHCNNPSSKLYPAWMQMAKKKETGDTWLSFLIWSNNRWANKCESQQKRFNVCIAVNSRKLEMLNNLISCILCCKYIYWEGLSTKEFEKWGKFSVQQPQNHSWKTPWQLAGNAQTTLRRQDGIYNIPHYRLQVNKNMGNMWVHRDG